MKGLRCDRISAPVIALILSFLITAVCCVGYVVLYEWWAIAPIIGMIIAFPLASFLHECGHVLFGLFVKIKAVPKFSFHSSSSCQIIPKTDKGLKSRIIFTTLGGITVNFLCVALGVVAFFVVALPFWLTVVAPASLYFFVLNVLPVVLVDGKTDGLVILELAKNTDSSKVLLAVLTVQAQVLNGKPIEEVDEKLLFDLPQIQEDDQAFISLTELRYEYFKAKGEEDKAELWRTRFEQLKEEYM